MSICLAFAMAGMLVFGIAQSAVGDPVEGRGLLLSALSPLALGVVLALVYRTAAHGGLASQDLIDKELRQVQQEAGGGK